LNKVLYLIVQEDLIKALEGMGYRRVGKRLEWRRGKFHFIITGRRKDRLLVNLHMDVPSLGRHLVIQSSEVIRREMARIRAQYKRIRASNISPKTV